MPGITKLKPVFIIRQISNNIFNYGKGQQWIIFKAWHDKVL